MVTLPRSVWVVVTADTLPIAFFVSMRVSVRPFTIRSVSTVGPL